MAKQNSVNLDITNNSDGFDISGGTTSRKLTVSGADISLTGSGSATLTFPTTTGTVALVPGSDTQIAFNDGGSALGGDSGLTYNKTTDSLTVTGDLAVNGSDITTTGSGTATLFNSNALTLNLGGAATAITMGDATTATTTVRGGTLVGNTATQAVFNTTATTLNIGGAATAITMGDSTSATTTIRGGTLVGNTVTQALFNTTATTLNLGGAATAITMGDSTSATVTIRGGTLVGNTTTQNLFNTTATTLNVGGAATAITVGASAGTTTTVRGGTLVGNTTTQNLFNTTATTLNLGGAATTLTVGATTGSAALRNPTLTLGNTTSTVQTNSGSSNSITFSPYGNFVVAPTTNPQSDGDFATLTVTNTQGGGQVQITGADLYLSNRYDGLTTYPSTIIFEGTTADAYETTITVTDPTADRTITLPNATGTVALVSGSDTQVMFNDGGSALGGDSGLTYNKTTDTLVAGRVETTGFEAKTVGGDEGGEILLGKPVTNTTLSGTGVTIDVYQNRLRFFEQGGTARGAYIDLTTAGAGVSTNLLSGGGSGTPGGSDTYVQFNDGGSFGGDSGLSYNKTTDSLTITGDLAVNGGDLTTSAGTVNIFDNGPTAINIGTSSATTVSLGANANGAAVNMCNGNIIFSRTGSGMAYYSNLTDGSASGMNIKCNPTGSPIQIGDVDASNNTTILKIDDSVGTIAFYTGSGSYTFPTTNGTSGQVLFTNGSGTLAWGDVSAGVGVSVSTTSSSVTVNLDDIFLFGNGSDGDATVTGSTTLTRDMFYNNLTISGSGSINTAGFRIFVLGTLDITAAAANAIQRNGTAGSNASSTTGATAVTALTSGSVGSDTGSGAGGSGGATTGTQGSNPTASTVNNGGQNGASGKGGNGTSGNGGALRAATTPTTCPVNRIESNLIRGVTLIHGGICGAGGSGGGGDGTAGGGGGSGGLGGGVVFVAAKTISRGGSTAAGCISANGGNGGNGFQPAAGNRGGGGGGSGGGGGWVYLVYNTLSGSSASNAIRTNGGTGGNGANGSGTGTAGDGGTGGGGGRINVFNMTAGSLTSSVGTTGTANTGATGGAGETLQVTL